MSNAAEQVTARLKQIRERAATTAPRAGATAMAHLGVAATQVQLSRYSHTAGTPTPASKGGPPAVVSGDLRRRVSASPTVSAGFARYTATVGSTVIYARIQEFGGEIRPKNAKRLRFVSGGTVHWATKVEIPARPYLQPTTEKLIASGVLTEVAAKAFLAALSR